MQTVNGIMTTATVKPETRDKDNMLKNPAYLALTFKVNLDEFTAAELGNLLITSANGDVVEVSIEAKQLLMEVPDGVELVEEGTQTAHLGTKDIDKQLDALE